jgi:hypothetical protein
LIIEEDEMDDLHNHTMDNSYGFEFGYTRREDEIKPLTFWAYPQRMEKFTWRGWVKMAFYRILPSGKELVAVRVMRKVS